MTGDTHYGFTWRHSHDQRSAGAHGHAVHQQFTQGLYNVGNEIAAARRSASGDHQHVGFRQSRACGSDKGIEVIAEDAAAMGLAARNAHRGAQHHRVTVTDQAGPQGLIVSYDFVAAGKNRDPRPLGHRQLRDAQRRNGPQFRRPDRRPGRDDDIAFFQITPLIFDEEARRKGSRMVKRSSSRFASHMRTME